MLCEIIKFLMLLLQQYIAEIIFKLKNMKKLFTLIIAVIAITTMTGCSNQEVVTEEPEQIQQEQPQPEKTAYNLAFNAEYLGDRTFKVEGTTDLPNDSKIGINIYDVDYFDYDDADSDWRLENLTYIGDSTIIQNGTFSITITSNEIVAPLKSDEYTVEVSFNPRGQSSAIKGIVGENGEYLDGEFLDNSIEDLVMLETTSTINLK